MYDSYDEECTKCLSCLGVGDFTWAWSYFVRNVGRGFDKDHPCFTWAVDCPCPQGGVCVKDRFTMRRWAVSMLIRVTPSTRKIFLTLFWRIIWWYIDQLYIHLYIKLLKLTIILPPALDFCFTIYRQQFTCAVWHFDYSLESAHGQTVTLMARRQRAL